jgi:hypothetical protein
MPITCGELATIEEQWKIADIVWKISTEVKVYPILTMFPR